MIKCEHVSGERTRLEIYGTGSELLDEYATITESLFVHMTERGINPINAVKIMLTYIEGAIKVGKKELDEDD